MLNLIYGRSKSGKTTFIDKKVCELVNNGESRVLVIVPDQITFETEKSYLKLLGPKLAQNVLVLGFSRMCDYVFEFTGAIRKPAADDATKAILMSVALEEVKDNLLLYSDKALSTDLAKLMLSAGKELAMSGISSDEILVTAENADELTYKKIHDIYTATSAMNSLLINSFEDPDSELSAVADILRERRIFDGYYIFIDSYLSFTAPETEVLSALMSQCRELFITLSYDGVSKDGFFTVPGETASKLKSLANYENLQIAEPYLCTYSEFYRDEALSHIEENVFADSKESYTEPTDAVTLYMANDRYDEVDFIAREIRRLVIDFGVRYSEIAVVGRGLSQYNEIISNTFDKYEISYFADKPHDITAKPLIRLISSCFNAILSGFDKDDILSLLKTGLTSADNEDILLFENYLYTWQINYRSLFDEFTANPRGFSDQFTFDDAEELRRVESVRKLVMNSLKSFKEEFSDSTASQLSKGLYELLLTLGVDIKITDLADTLDKFDEIAFSQEQIRLWEIFIETIDRTDNVIGDRKLTIKRFYELFMLQLNLTDISFIPRALDQVVVGDIERLRLGGRRCVFVLGAVEGEFPRDNISTGIFTANQRSELSRLSILVDADDEHNAFREQYLAYYALTSASEKVFVSFPVAELSGEAKSGSIIISELITLVPELKRRTHNQEETSDLIWADKPGYDYFARYYRSSDLITETLRNYYSKSPDFTHKVKSLDDIINADKRFVINDKTISKRLFGKDMYLSATRIEKYHLCRFSYFCQYGLKANERRKASIDALEYGSFVHYILEYFFKSFKKTEFTSITDDNLSKFVSEIADSYADNHFGGLSAKSARFLYLYSAVKETSCILIKHIMEELSQSDFTPVDFELDIGNDISAYRLELSNDVSVTVTGKVDRADILKKDGKSYIRIVDYKTGTKVFSLSDVIYGLNLQMLLYLSVIKDKGKDRYKDEIVPAGVLYMPSFVPTLEMAADDDAEKIMKERNKKLRMNGILLDDESVLKAMDKDLSGLYIPVSMGAKGIKGTDNLATLEEFGAVFAHIDKLISEMATELLDGKIDASPATLTSDACQWCPYSSVCIGKSESSFRSLYKLNRDEILRELGIEKKEVTE